MPIYEYQCGSCSRSVEALQKITDPPLTQCPHCQGTLTRLVSRTSFHLKGTGWYATDYKKAAGAGKPAASSTESKPDAAPATPGSEAKSDSSDNHKTPTPAKPSQGDTSGSNKT